MFDRYEIVELIAIGGMAQVYRARLTTPQGTSKPVVVKKLLAQLAENREFLDMFIDEARISMPLSHANIVQVFDFGQVDRDYFMIMEYIHGINLEHIIQRCRESGIQIPIPTCLFIASEVAKGLDYAHRYTNTQRQPIGIIHRDVSPQNILIGFDGSVKLTDFGIAKAKSRIHQTRHGIIRGKACYLSPEQAECDELDGRSDQFSLALVLFELLTGVRPFEGDTELATLNNVRNLKPNAPSLLRPEISSRLDGVVLTALARKPSDRFENAGIFQNELTAILRSLAPDYSSYTLSDWLGQVIRPKNHPVDDDTRVAAEPALSREEILKMKTVIIPKKPPEAQRRKSRGFLIAALPILIVLATLIAITQWELPLSFDDLLGRNKDAVSPAVPPPIPDSTEEPKTKVSPESLENDVQAHSTRIQGVQTSSPVNTPEPVRFGTLHLNADPWALVELDGKRLERHTPLFNIRVRAGRHKLRFFNPEINLEKTITVWVFPQRTKTVSISLTEP